MKERTVILVVGCVIISRAIIPDHHYQTHNLTLAGPIADFVIALENGNISSQGSMKNALDNSTSLRETGEKDDSTDRSNSDPSDDKQQDKSGQLTSEEETSEGHVGWAASEHL